MCGGSGGNSGSTQYNWNDDMAPLWKGALGEGVDLSNKPYQQYGGKRIADMTGNQEDAIESIRHFAMSGGSPVTQAANGELQRTLEGYWMGGDPTQGQVNPWQNASATVQGSNPWRDVSASVAGHNPWRGVSANVGKNQYSGQSPEFMNMLKQGTDEITNAYKQGTSADTTRMFNMAGAFGGSAHQNAVSNNEAALGKTLSNYASGMQNEQYNRSAGLQEGQLGRELQNQQFDKSLGGQWDEQMFARQLQNQQFDKTVGSQLDESMYARQLQNQQFDKQLGGQWYQQMQDRDSNAYQNERNRMMGAVGGGQNEQALTLQRANALMGVGDVERGYNQDLLNQGYNDWQTQQQHPYTQMDWLTGLFSRAQGGMSPNSTTTQAGYQASPFSAVLGAGLLGKGFGAF